MRRYQCERCGGVGRQPAGCWNGEAYAAPAGICDECKGVGILGFSEVIETTFFERVGKSDCHPRIINDRYPYTSQFTTPGGLVIGAIVGVGEGKQTYFLPSA